MFDAITTKLEEATGTTLATPEVQEIVEASVPALQEQSHGIKALIRQNVANDYEFARANFREMISKGMTAVDGAISLVKQSESPRVYEATSTFMKTLGELNAALMDTHEKAAKADPTAPSAGNKQEAQTINNNNIVFSGTSEDLASMISARMASKPPVND